MSGPFFMKSKVQAFDHSQCHDCGRFLNDVNPETSYWNPNRNARIKNICSECYEYRQSVKQKRWDERLRELEQFKAEQE